MPDQTQEHPSADNADETPTVNLEPRWIGSAPVRGPESAADRTSRLARQHDTLDLPIGERRALEAGAGQPAPTRMLPGDAVPTGLGSTGPGSTGPASAGRQQTGPQLADPQLAQPGARSRRWWRRRRSAGPALPPGVVLVPGAALPPGTVPPGAMLVPGAALPRAAGYPPVAPPPYAPPPYAPAPYAPAPYAPAPQPPHRPAPQYPPVPPQQPGAGRSGWPRRRRRRLPVVSLTLLVLTVACCGWVVDKVKPYYDQWPASIAADRGVAGLVEVDDAARKRRAKALLNKVGSFLDQDSVVGLYADAADRGRLVTVIGVTRFVAFPDDDLDDAVKAITSATELTGVHEVAVDWPDGAARCGTGRSGGQPLTACGWADHGSVGIVLFTRRSEAGCVALTATIRETLISRD